jgi:GntR family transcriptional regulator
LPPEDGLVERFKVSRTTVRKAIQNLVERGLVEVRRGKGTFVIQSKITQELTELTGFAEGMQALGRTPTFDETYLPHEIREKVWENDLEVEPIFALLENRHDTPLVEAEYKLEAAAAHQRR